MNPAIDKNFVTKFMEFLKKKNKQFKEENMHELMQEYIETLPLKERLEIEKGHNIDPKTEPLNLTELLKRLRRIEKNPANPNIEDLGQISVICRQEHNMEELFNHGTAKVMMDIMKNTKDPHVLEVAFWSLAELNMHPHNTKRFYSIENRKFVETFLDLKYPLIINGIAIKMIVDFTNNLDYEHVFDYLDKMIPTFVVSKMVVLSNYAHKLDGKTLIPHNSTVDFLSFILRYVLTVVPTLLNYNRYKTMGIINKADWKALLPKVTGLVKSQLQTFIKMIDPNYDFDTSLEREYLKTSREKLHEKFHNDPVITSQKKCFTCQKHESLELKMRNCSRCKKAHYCSKECQAKHWGEHKKVCQQK